MQNTGFFLKKQNLENKSDFETRNEIIKQELLIKCDKKYKPYSFDSIKNKKNLKRMEKIKKTPGNYFFLEINIYFIKYLTLIDNFN